MYIEKLHIDSFGRLKAFDCTLQPGLNIIEGANESGKTTIAMFIKFMLYGLSGRSASSGQKSAAVRSAQPLSEREKYVSWDTGLAQGTLTLRCAGEAYRIERTLQVTGKTDGEIKKESVRENVKIIDISAAAQIKTGMSPGEYFFGVDESVFVNTAFIRQLPDTVPDTKSVFGAIENLLLTGDEAADTQSALTLLDRARIALKYKKGDGGLIFELSEQRRELCQRLAKAQSDCAEIIENETALGESMKKYAEAEQKLASLEKLCFAYETISQKRLFDEADGLEASLEETKAKLRRAEDEKPDRDFAAGLNEKARRLENARVQCDKTRTAIALCPEHGDFDMNIVSCEQVTDEAMTYKAKKRASAGAAVVMLALATLCAVAGAFMLSAGLKNMLYIPLGGALVLLCAAIACFASSSKARRELDSLCRRWGADDIDSLAAAVKAAIAELEEKKLEKTRHFELERTLEFQTEAQTEAENELRLALSEIGISDNIDIDTALSAAVAVCNEKIKLLDEKTRMRDHLTGELAAIMRQISGIDRAAVEERYSELKLSPDFRDALSLTPEGYAAAKRDLGFTSQSMKAMKQRTDELDRRLAALRAVCEPPSRLYEEIDALESEIEDAKRRYDALMKAYSSLQSAAEGLRRRVIPNIAEDACEIMKSVTNGKYESLCVGADFNIFYEDGGMTRPLDCLSAGTGDLAYIALRAALTASLMKNAAPSFYDEAFARIDEARLARLIEMLAGGGASDRQFIILSCRALEASLAHGVNVIEL